MPIRFRVFRMVTIWVASLTLAGSGLAETPVPVAEKPADTAIAVPPSEEEAVAEPATEPTLGIVEEEAKEHPVPVPQPILTPTQSEIEICEAEKAALAKSLAAMARAQIQSNGCAALEDQVATLEDEIKFCRDDVTQSRRSSQALNERLEQCTNFADNSQEDPQVLELKSQVEQLREELADRSALLQSEQSSRSLAEARVAELEARLTEFNIAINPGFSYLGQDVGTSFVTVDDALRLKAGIPRLREDQCAAGLDWMLSQLGSARALRRVVWVWSGAEVKLCARDRDDNILIVAPRRSDKAHIVVFQ